MIETKTCAKCSTSKPVTDFYLVKRGRYPYCKICCKAINDSKKEYRRQHYSALKSELGLEVLNARQRQINKNNPISRLLARAKSRAKTKGLAFDLTHSDIIIPKQCPVLGISMECNDGRQGYNSASLDRFLPELGYIKGNVRVISWRANCIKNNGSVQEFENLFRFLNTGVPIFPSEEMPKDLSDKFLRQMFWMRKSAAKKKEIPFTLTLSDIHVPTLCPILGIPLRQSVGRGSTPNSGNSPTLDKLVPHLGYTPDNVAVISWRANKLKHDANLEEIKSVLEYIRNQ